MKVDVEANKLAHLFGIAPSSLTHLIYIVSTMRSIVLDNFRCEYLSSGSFVPGRKGSGIFTSISLE